MKTCPFCGSNSLKINARKSGTVNDTDGRHYNLYTGSVRCNSCHARGPTTTIKSELFFNSKTHYFDEFFVKKWNERVPEEISVTIKKEEK